MGTVHDATAYVAPPHTDNDGIPHPGYISFMEGEIQVTVEGYYPIGELIEIANSLSTT